MQSQIVYVFKSAQVANRFLNALKHWSVADVTAKFYAGSDKVQVSYIYADSGFDRTAAELDDLVEQYDGEEYRG
jgi:hypothetical protein